MTQFSEHYKSFSNSQLLEVLSNQSDYDPEAVKDAKNELNQRELSEKELKEAHIELELRKKEELELIKGKSERDEKFKAILNHLNPIQSSAPGAEKTIRIISLIFGLIAISSLIKEFEIIKMAIADAGNLGFGGILFLLPIILISLGIVLFWFRKASGWILLTAYLTHSTLNSMGLIILTWNSEPSGFAVIDNLFSQPSLTSLILLALFFGGSLWALNRKPILEQFHIKEKTALITISFTLFLTIFLIAPYF